MSPESTESPESSRGFLAKLANLPSALWSRIGPAPRTRRGVSFSAGFLAIALGGYVAAHRLHTGEGLWVDTGIGVAVALAIVLLAPWALALVIGLVRFLPALFGRIGVGAFLACAFILSMGGFSSLHAMLGAGAIVVLAGLLFGALAVVTSGELREKGLFKKAWVSLCGVAGLGGFVVGIWWVLDRGSDQHIVRPVLAATRPEPLAVANPGDVGPHAVATLTYGSGTDRRPEFGADVDTRTEPVNGRPFVKMPKGFQGRLRRRFWGFDAGCLPINGRVWYPTDGEGPFPLILIVHGNHTMAEYSDPGYAYLGTHFASRGFIFVSVDENFLNSGGRLFGGMSKENDARAWILLQHLDVWRQWSKTEGNRWKGRVDMAKIGLIGHSRGGEAVYHAALFNRLRHYPDDASVEFDFGFSILGVISIAPSDGQYRPASRYAAIRDVSFFTIQGGHDADVSSFVGDRMYNRMKLSSDGDRWKASLFVYRANHGQFNTVWGDSDTSPPRALMLNRGALLTGEDQRKIAKVFFGAFFEATLLGKTEFVELFRDPRRGAPWLPDMSMVSRFEDGSWRAVTDFDEDFDVTTIPGGGVAKGEGLVVWREGDIKLRSGGKRYNSGVFLGWNAEAVDGEGSNSGGAVEAVAKKSDPTAPASFELVLPGDLKLSGKSILVLHLAASDEKPKAKDYSVKDDENETDNDDDDDEKKGDGDEDKKNPKALDFTVELVDSDGTTVGLSLSRFGDLLPPLKSQFMRGKFLEGRYKASEPNLQTFELPLLEFAKAEPKWRPGKLAKIRLVFDKSMKGVVVLDRVGFAGGR